MDTSGALILTGQRGGRTDDRRKRAEAMVEAVFRKERGQIVASLSAMTDVGTLPRNASRTRSPAPAGVGRDGVPAHPGTWFTTAARNRAIGVLPRRANEAVKIQQAQQIESYSRVRHRGVALWLHRSAGPPSRQGSRWAD